MRLLAVISACVVALAMLPVADAQATPSADMVKARAAFQRGDYNRAIPVLVRLLYPNAKLADREELAEAHLLLGVSYFETGNRDEARAEFERALRQDQEIRLDPLFVSEEAVDFFEEQKAVFVEQAKKDARKREVAKQLAAWREAIVLEKRPYYVNFLPFGAGQFQNGDNGKGIFFSVAQGVTGGTSLGIFAYHALKYGFRGDVPRDEASTVRFTQQIQIGASLACLGFIAWGIIDSLVNYERVIRTRADDSLLPEELRDLLETDGEPERDPEPTSFRIAPTPLSGGAGVTMSWEF